MNSLSWRSLLRRIPALVPALVAVWLVAQIGLTAWEITLIKPLVGNARQATVVGCSGTFGEPGSTLFEITSPQCKLDGEPGLLGGADFRLSGVVASNDKRVAHAIIETGGIFGAYSSGDTVAVGTTLQKVQPKAVLPRRSGQVLHLPLVGLSSGAGGGSLRNHNARQDWSNAAYIPAMPPSEFLRMEPIMDAGGRMAGYRIFPPYLPARPGRIIG